MKPVALLLPPANKRSRRMSNVKRMSSLLLPVVVILGVQQWRWNMIPVQSLLLSAHRKLETALASGASLLMSEPVRLTPI